MTTNGLEQLSFFESIVYYADCPEYLENLNKIMDEYVLKAREEKQKEIKERNERYNTDVGDHGMSYHSHGRLYEDERLHKFELFVRTTARYVLEHQGFDVSNYELDYTEMWVQEFADHGGGHHDTHVHWDNHVSGCYFLKCSDRTSKPIFRDPRAGRMMLNLPIKNHKRICTGMEMHKLKIKPGKLVLFNSYLPHQFDVDDGVDPFRFIHFNIQARPIDKTRDQILA